MTQTFKLNQDAPDFKLPKISGGSFSLSEALESQDQWYLITFFRGSWCPACMSELDEFQDSLDYFKKHDVRVVSITQDRVEDLEKMVEDHGFTFPVLVDEDLEFASSYGVHYHDEQAPYEDHGTHGEPAYFLLDEKGKVLYQQRQTSPFGRPHPNELRKTIKYIKKNLK
ncbi:peroxiredoxin family protein [Halobacillus sp. ACCC02827]|uniref:peroxiredoxin family protein n=1 Tax=Bacillaceae TaxID=186817 RepID=UPI0002A50001|nr:MULTISPECIES: peroxiredoxin family protein [Bacillaceae]ELK44650.1 putative peroxiredoxin [Halobacillus sp. BAB-2008]QHT47013.1 redoxin domain-containing protein [Bacillus sp. SB49]WJE14239.1 peroxiredoxin family protein [Halobacillus sp. ACCC02827]